LTPEDRLKLLLGKGYFPNELPPVFVTDTFAQHANYILAEWEAKKVFKVLATVNYKRPGKPKVKLAASYKYIVAGTEAEVISKPKRGFERRNIHVTHPLPQALLAKEISDNWETICRWLATSRYSVDRLKFAADSERGISDINFRAHAAKKNFIEATADWLVLTDITRFYPSIYTHSIPWAAYGKTRVKADLPRYVGALGDRIDALLRSCNRDQTVGIPIGPETSRIVAEIISSRLDQHLFERQPLDQNRADRLQDDWFVGADDLVEAEKTLSTLHQVYREYGLEINGSKTSIDRVVSSHAPTWKSELSGFLSHRNGALQGARLREFFDLSIRLQVNHRNDPVINFALAVLERDRYHDDDLANIETFLLKAAQLSPISIDKIARIIINIFSANQRLSLPRIVQRFTSLAERHLEHGNTFEAVWLIYALRGTKSRLNSTIISDLCADHAGSVLPLILLDMESKGLVSRKLPKSRWEAAFLPDRVSEDWCWLLAYEGIRHGWLTDKHGLMSKPFFKPFSDKTIVFYDETKNIARSRKAIRARVLKSRTQTSEVVAFLRKWRGFTDETY
jgi:hypothetical protein